MGSRPVSRRRPAAAIALAASFLGPAHAGLTLAPSAGVAFAYDSNLFRAPETPAPDEAEREPVSEVTRTSSAGIALAWTYGGQEMALSGGLRDVRYDENDRLDHTSHDVDLEWRYRSSRMAAWEAQVTRSRELDDFGDRGDTARDLVTELRPMGRVSLSIGPLWEVQLEAGYRDIMHSADGRERFDRRTRETLALFRRDLSQRTTAGIGYRQSWDEFPERARNDPLGDRATQRALFADLRWRPGPSTRIEARAGMTHRQARSDAARDFSTPTWSATLSREWSAKTRTRLQLFRRVYPSGSVDAVSVADTGAEARFIWRATPLLTAESGIRFNEQRYKDTAAAAGAERTDRTAAITMEVSYRFLRGLFANLALVAERQNSSDRSAEFEQLSGRLGLETRFGDE